MINMSLDSGFDAISNDGLLVEIFQVIPKLEEASELPTLGTNVTKIGQVAEG